MNTSHFRRAASFLAMSALALAALAGNALAAEPPRLPKLPPPSQAFSCPTIPGAGAARCHAIVRTDAAAKPDATGGPAGYSPADLRAAYNAPSGNGGQLVAIVDAFDDPRAESDLGVYRSKFGLPPCTTANGCFAKVDQRGGTNYPRQNVGWAQEISLDLDMVSAICPNCHILLVEADSNSFDSLGAAVNQAVRMGAKVVSNSYGGGEWGSEGDYEATYYNHPGVAVVASTGDDGYGVEFPASAQHVIGAGGTSLSRDSSARGWSETVWDGAGSGCSDFISKPAWQHDAGCSHRTVADVSAVADPGTGVAVYDTYFSSGWLVFGGTSVASPIIGAFYALAGNSSVNDASYLYGATSGLNDVTSGSNGNCGSYLCQGAPGYDGPTGLGTPNGDNAFLPAPARDYSISASPASQTVTAGGSTSFTVTLSSSNGYSSGVNLSVGSLPTGVNASFSAGQVAPTSGGASSTLSITTTASAAAGSYTVDINGAGTDPASIAHKTSVTLKINAPVVPDFGLAVSPSSATVTAGSSASYGLTLTAVNGYSSPVSLSVSGAPTGVSPSFNPTSVTPTSGGATSTLTLGTAANTTPGTYQLTITAADSGSTSHSTKISLTVNAPAVADFSAAVTPSSSSVTAGSSATYKVTLTASNGYASSVALSVGGLPTGASGSFSPTSVTPTSGGASSTLTVTTTAGLAANSYPFTITATGGDSSKTTHTAAATLVVKAAGNFSVGVSPSSATIFRTQKATFTITLNATNDYSTPVTLTAGGLSADETATFSSNTVTPTASGATTSLTISTGVFTPPGTQTITITGTASDGSGLVHSTSATLVVR